MGDYSETGVTSQGRVDIASRVAFFDLDRTVLSINSGSAWVRSERRGGHITAGQLLKALWWISRYKLGWAELEGPLLQAIRALEGTEERAMEELEDRLEALDAEIEYKGQVSLNRFRVYGLGFGL